MHKFLFTALALLASSAAFADSGTDVWKSVKDWSAYCPHEEMGTITAYYIVDVDNDGISDCFVSGDYDSYGFLTCGDGKGSASVNNIELVVNSLNTTSLAIANAQGKNWILNAGGCGSGCIMMEYYKIENSKWTICYQNVDMYKYSEEDYEDDLEIESEYSFYKPNVMPRKISGEYYYRKTPFHPTTIDAMEFDWIQIK